MFRAPARAGGKQQKEKGNSCSHREPPIRPGYNRPVATFFQELNELMAAGVPLVTVTIVDTAGSTPQDRGAKMIVTAEGLRSGTVGGGRVETKAIAEARSMLAAESQETTKFVSWGLQKDVGMTCGGVVKLYFELLNVARWNVVIFGAGHVAQALARVLVNLDCRVTCIDPRPEWLEKLPSSPRIETIESAEPASLLPALPAGAFVLLMTMGHTTDRPILAGILKTRRFPYLGVIGSDSKAAVLRSELTAEGIPPEQQQFRCPVGLEIGTNHPYEIAISIVAQMLQVRDGKV